MSVYDLVMRNGWYGMATEAAAPGGGNVWYVDGNLKFNANVSMQGYVMIFVSGSMEVGSNVNVYSSVPVGVTPPTSTAESPNTDQVRPFMASYMPDGVTLGVYSAGAFKIQGGAAVMGQLYSGGDFEMPGTSTIYGSATAMGNIKSTGKMMIWFAQPSDALLDLTAGPAGASGAMKMLSYVEW